MTNIQLNQRFAIVVGATGGWGPDVARRLADRNMGLLLLGSCGDKLNTLAEDISGNARQVFTQICEPGVPGELARVIREAKLWLPAVDVVVCNAAPSHAAPGSQLRLDDVSSVEYTRSPDAIELAREFLPSMIRNRWGRVVFLAPRMSEREVPALSRNAGGRPAFCELTRQLAIEVGRSRATVNTVAQSWANLANAVHSLREQCRCQGLPNSARQSVLTAQAVAMRLLEGGDIPILVEYLLSTDGGSVNGLILPVASEVAAPAVA